MMMIHKATKDLRILCEHELLLKKGEKKGTYYLAGNLLHEDSKPLSEEPKSLNEEPKTLSEEPQSTNIEQLSLSEEPKTLSEEPKTKKELLASLPLEIRQQITMLKKRESDKAKIIDVIIQLCKIRPFSLYEMSSILNKTENYISTQYLKPLLGKEIEYKYPGVVNHPEQAYVSKTVE